MIIDSIPNTMMIVAVMKDVSNKNTENRLSLHIPGKVANFGVVSTNHTIGAASNTPFSHGFRSQF
jgi:hypothetical protein